ncbi:histidine--tRNA ligase, partial [Haemophilus influenzae HK1212]
MFRHEKPQKGRYRQFTQVGIEALGLEGPDIDAEMITMTKDLWNQLGFKNIELQVNTLGTVAERVKYRNILIKYLEDNIDVLDEDGRRRLYSNPLRVLDSKNKSMQDICNNAPKLIEYLGKDSLCHYYTWLNFLEKLGISYVENTRLVRGLDYYN